MTEILTHGSDIAVVDGPIALHVVAEVRARERVADLVANGREIVS